MMTTDVIELREEIGAPGLLNLQEAMMADSGKNVHLPHNHYRDAVCFASDYHVNLLEAKSDSVLPIAGW